MKVIIVGPYSRPVGGVQVHITQLEEFLESNGHTCFIINMGKNKALNSDKIVSPKSAVELVYHLLRKRNHVCHIHLGGNLHMKLLLLVFFSNFIFYKRCAVTVHSGGLPKCSIPKTIFQRWLIYASFGICRAVICVNSEIADYFKRIGVNANSIYIISPFAFKNILNNSPIPEPLAGILAKKKPLFCNIGGLEAEYDLDLLLRVFSRYVYQYPASGLIIIGSGSLHATLQRRISDLGLDERVILTGDMSHNRALKILTSCDCYIRTSLYDGDCLSLREALYLKVPAIATDTGMRPDGTILFPIGDEETLLKRMIEVTSFNYNMKKILLPDEISYLGYVERILVGLT